MFGLVDESEPDLKSEVNKKTKNDSTPMLIILKGSAQVVFRDPEGVGH